MTDQKKDNLDFPYKPPGKMVRDVAESEGCIIRDETKKTELSLPEPRDARYYFDNEPPPPDPIVISVFDRGSKLFIIGGSKTRKSFLTLQLALSLAAGRSFLDWDVPRPMRVLVVQYEIREEKYHGRVNRMMKGLRLTSHDIDGRLKVLNLRGHKCDISVIADLKEPFDLILFDPFYKILSEAGADENKATDVGQVLKKIDKLAEKTGSGVGVVHHDAKGRPGDRALTDRGSGSGIVARDYDACILLTPHASIDDAMVVETTLRDYPPTQPFVIAWGNYCFNVRDDLPVSKETPTTARNKIQQGLSIKEVAEFALEESKEPVECGKLKENLKKGVRPVLCKNG